ncbi:hypothetical protein T492DRAFT_961313, partial [Pavlovales sp. CCMP2436]
MSRRLLLQAHPRGLTPAASRWSRVLRFEWQGRAVESVSWPVHQRALRVAPHVALLARHVREVEDVRRAGARLLHA